MIGAEQRLARRPSPAPIRPQDIVGEAIRSQQGELLQNLLADPGRMAPAPLEPVAGSLSAPTHLSTGLGPVPRNQMDLAPAHPSGSRGFQANQIAGGVGIIASLIGALTGNEVVASAGSGLAQGAEGALLRAVSRYDADTESYQEGVRRLEALAAQNDEATRRIFLQHDLRGQEQEQADIARRMAAEYETKLGTEQKEYLLRLERGMGPSFGDETQRMNAVTQRMFANDRRQDKEAEETPLDKKITQQQGLIERLKRGKELSRRKDADEETLNEKQIEIDFAEEEMRSLAFTKHVGEILPSITDPAKPTADDTIAAWEAYLAGKIEPGLFMAIVKRSRDADLISEEDFQDAVTILAQATRR